MTQFDKQLQLVREGPDKRAAHNAVCTALGRLDYRKFTANEKKFTNGELREWIETEGARIKERWGTKIADSLVANRGLFTKIKVPRRSPGVWHDAPHDTLLVWPKVRQLYNLLKLARRWHADEVGTVKVDGQTVVRFWWD